jgi:hypothetical protein
MLYAFELEFYFHFILKRPQNKMKNFSIGDELQITILYNFVKTLLK